MAFEPSDLDHKQLDVFLAAVLDAYKDQQISQGKALDLIGHVVTAAALDDEPTFKAAIWLEPSRYLQE